MNHPLEGIADQLWYLTAVLEQAGVAVCHSPVLKVDCLNLLIESFVESDSEMLRHFCAQHQKQVGIVMTEHIEREANDEFSFGGVHLGDVEYIGNKEQRLYSLLSLAELTYGYFTLGELPELSTWASIVAGHTVYRLPYPDLPATQRSMSERENEFVFTGTLTAYRERKLRELAKQHRIAVSEIADDDERRVSLYRSAKVALNIPQTATWRWISPMRVLFGLRTGTPTLHMGQPDESAFGRIVVEAVDVEDALADPERFYEEQYRSYRSLLATSANPVFPSSVFELWWQLEGPQASM